jgi:hypothetical protein
MKVYKVGDIVDIKVSENAVLFVKFSMQLLQLGTLIFPEV